MLLQFNIMGFYFNILIYKKKIQSIIYFCDAILNFHQSILQSSVSHDPLEIILIC